MEGPQSGGAVKLALVELGALGDAPPSAAGFAREDVSAR